jgi:hypothetical protein
MEMSFQRLALFSVLACITGSMTLMLHYFC